MWHEAQKFLLKDRYIGPLINKHGDCLISPCKPGKYFEKLCGDIIGQQLSGKAADTIEQRFRTAVDMVTPENIIKTPDNTLRNCGMWGKVSFIKDLAEKSISGLVNLKMTESMPDDEVVEMLVGVKGIGRWTAEMFLMFSLGRPDIFPIDDLGIKKGYEKVTQRKFDKEKSSRFALTHWRPYRTVASWYLWRSIE